MRTRMAHAILQNVSTPVLLRVSIAIAVTHSTVNVFSTSGRVLYASAGPT